MPSRDDLTGDCAACAGLCCVGPGFAASADFAIDKPAGRPCPHLAGDARCTVHDRLDERGFGGCVTFDCFGAGQRLVAGRADRGPDLFADLETVRALQEILWYLVEAREEPRAAPVHDEVDALAARVGAAVDEVVRGDGVGGDGVDVDGWRAEAGPVLGRVSELVRAPAGTDPARPDLTRADLTRADLVGRDLRGHDLVGAGLRGALLLGADLRGVDLTRADLLGADLRGADVRGADLGGSLFLTRPQLRAARGDATTRVPAWFAPPARWGTVRTTSAPPTPLPTPAPPPRRRPRAGSRRR